jgi:hypothetical protein
MLQPFTLNKIALLRNSAELERFHWRPRARWHVLQGENCSHQADSSFSILIGNLRMRRPVA